jgi:hypothetical protein
LTRAGARSGRLGRSTAALVAAMAWVSFAAGASAGADAAPWQQRLAKARALHQGGSVRHTFASDGGMLRRSGAEGSCY